MANLENFSNAELLFDRQESFNDMVACLACSVTGIPGTKERLVGNMDIINTIIIECERRGFDPAKYQEASDD